ncbi:MAG: peptide chain release factor 1 [Chloroflexota bacterium]
MQLQLEKIEARYRELDELMADPEITRDIKRLQALARERASIEDLVSKYREYKSTLKSLAETRAMLNDGLDEGLVALAKQEITELESKELNLLQEIKMALLPKDPNDDKDIIVEIRAGAGGNEASLFAADLYRMYSRYAQMRKWQIEVIDASQNDVGGFKEIIFEIRGQGAFSRLKYERGVHRVQRVPATEASGRIHTSTATIAVLPEADEVEVAINPEDLRIDIFHSGGAGGQNVNKVATAVRITHLPTGVVAICQDERSQGRNKTKAMAVLRARIYDIEQRKQEEALVRERRAQVGGDRAEKIRTYNFPQDRITDHRINRSFHNLPRIMGGGIDDLIDTLATGDQAKKLGNHQV